MPSELHQIPLRVDDELYNRITQHLARMQKESPGVDIHRTDAVRQLVIRGLETVEKGKRG